VNVLVVILGWLLTFVGAVLVGAGIAGVAVREVARGVITIVVGALVIAGGVVVVFS
jgi:hypothetical protein